MHLRDYIAIGSCEICGKPVFSPTTWFSDDPIPRHKTCTCSIKSQLKVSGKIFSPEVTSHETIFEDVN